PSLVDPPVALLLITMLIAFHTNFLVACLSMAIACTYVIYVYFDEAPFWARPPEGKWHLSVWLCALAGGTVLAFLSRLRLQRDIRRDQDKKTSRLDQERSNKLRDTELTLGHTRTQLKVLLDRVPSLISHIDNQERYT